MKKEGPPRTAGGRGEKEGGRSGLTGWGGWREEDERDGRIEKGERREGGKKGRGREGEKENALTSGPGIYFDDRKIGMTMI